MVCVWGLRNSKEIRVQLMMLFRFCRGQKAVHSSAANEDSCGYSVMQIGAPICVPALFYVNYLH